MPGERMTIIFMLRYSLTVAEEVPADSAIGAVILSALRRHKAALPFYEGKAVSTAGEKTERSLLRSTGQAVLSFFSARMISA